MGPGHTARAACGGLAALLCAACAKPAEKDADPPETEAVLVYQTDSLPGRLYALPAARPEERWELTPPFTATGARVRRLAYSPDGTFVAVLASVEVEGTQLFVKRTAGGALRRLAFDGASATDAWFSPDSRWLAVSSYAKGRAEALHLVDLHADPARIVLSSPSERDAPAWSEDGRVLAFSSRKGRWQIVKLAAPQHVRDVAETGNVRHPMLSPAGQHLVGLAGGEARVLRTDGVGRPVVAKCPTGAAASVAWVTRTQFGLVCQTVPYRELHAVCDLRDGRCRSLGELSSGSRCGEFQTLSGQNAVYVVSLRQRRVALPAPIAELPPTVGRHRLTQAFNKTCDAFVFTRGDELVRVRLDPLGHPEDELVVPWTGAFGVRSISQLWLSPDANSSLVVSESGLRWVDWAELTQQAVEPRLVSPVVAGWIDDHTLLLRAAEAGKGPYDPPRPPLHQRLFTLTHGSQGLQQRAVFEADLHRGSQWTPRPGVSLAPDGRSALVVLGGGHHTEPQFEVAGSSDVPVLYDVARGRGELLIPKPSAPVGRLLGVTALGTRAVAFFASVDREWEVRSFVADYSRRQEIDAVISNLPRSYEVGMNGAVAAFHTGGRLSILELPAFDAPLAARVQSHDFSVKSAGFTEDGQWYVALAWDHALRAVQLQTGQVHVLSAPRVGGFSVAPKGHGVAFSRALGDGKEGLYYLDLDDPRPRFVDYWEARGSFHAWWFSGDGSQLAYSSAASRSEDFTLRMWRVGRNEAGRTRGVYKVGSGPVMDGNSASLLASASSLRGGHGLLLMSGVDNYISPRDIWVIPWLGSKSPAWRLPNDDGTLEVQQVADSDQLLALEANRAESRVRRYRIHAPRADATLAEVHSSVEMLRRLDISPTGKHVIYGPVQGQTYVRSLVQPDAPATPLSGAYRGCPAPSFSPDGRYIALGTRSGYRGCGLSLVDLEAATWSEASVAEGDVHRVYWLLSPR